MGGLPRFFFGGDGSTSCLRVIEFADFLFLLLLGSGIRDSMISKQVMTRSRNSANSGSRVEIPSSFMALYTLPTNTQHLKVSLFLELKGNVLAVLVAIRGCSSSNFHSANASWIRLQTCKSLKMPDKSVSCALPKRFAKRQMRTISLSIFPTPAPRRLPSIHS